MGRFSTTVGAEAAVGVLCNRTCAQIAAVGYRMGMIITSSFTGIRMGMGRLAACCAIAEVSYILSPIKGNSIICITDF